MTLREMLEKVLGGGYDNAHGSVDTYQSLVDLLNVLIDKLEPQ